MNQAKWMWQYGEYELYHSMILHMRREEYGAEYPPMWRVSAPSPWLELYADFETDKASYARLTASGKGYIVIDGRRYPAGERIPVAIGKHTAVVRVMNDKGLAAAFVEGEACPSGEGWYSRRLPGNLNDGIDYFPAGCEPAYLSPEEDPSVFPFTYLPREPVTSEVIEGKGELFDFGKESFARIVLESEPSVCLSVTYGESREEALDGEDAILSDTLTGKNHYILPARAFRYVLIKADAPFALSALDECAPAEREASYFSSDAEMNDILRISADTFRLCSREFYLDGIKRDRWVWSGDAFQSYMIDRYFRRDQHIMRRTILALGGDGIYNEHINTITDYSLYWLISVEEYHRHYGDEILLQYIYPKMQSMLCFCETRLNEDGFIEGAEGDWVFVDWTEYDKTGAVCAEQMLLRRAYEAMAYVGGLLGKDITHYEARAKELALRIKAYYWCEEKGAYIDSYASGKKHVTRHANILAVLFGYANEEEQASILRNVLLSDAVTRITTPYFAFYEMDALARLGCLSLVKERMCAYWGGMLRLGATTVWEEYVPEKTGAEHYAMYGKPFGKSLCHAWGAGPLYLFGRYFLGVEADKDGFTVTPATGGFEKISGEVLLDGGSVRVSAEENTISVYATCKGGVLVAFGKEYSIPVGRELIVEKPQM